jgi:DNA (cytosine-5)-methyltransferase 1
MPKKVHIVELFSGIGAQAKSLKRIASKRNIEIDFDATCEWDVRPIIAYFFIHGGKKEDIKNIHQTKEELIEILLKKGLTYDGKKPLNQKTLIRFSYDFLKLISLANEKNKNIVNITKASINDLPKKIDILTYSFPCQDLSNMGALHGFNKGIDRDAKNRSSLLWEVERLLLDLNKSNKKLPKVLLLENVVSLNAPRHRNNFELWQTFLKNLGYFNQVYTLYAPNFGVPQNRKRVFMISVLAKQNQIQKLTDYFKQNNLENIKDKPRPLKDYIDVDDTKYLNEWLESQPNNTPSRKTIWNHNPKLYAGKRFQKEITNTLTTKQDRHPNSGNIEFNIKNKKAKFRFLTPRECFRLMGFEDKDYEVLKNSKTHTRENKLLFTRDVLYKLTGNSIVVDMLDSVFTQIADLLELIE